MVFIGNIKRGVICQKNPLETVFLGDDLLILRGFIAKTLSPETVILEGIVLPLIIWMLYI